MKKIVTFPYHPDVETLIRFRTSLQGYQLAGFLSYKEDRNILSRLNKSIGFDGLADEDILCGCDALVILDNYRDYGKSKYYRIIDEALKLQKEVLVTPLAEMQLDLTKYKDKYQLLKCIPDGISDKIGENNSLSRAHKLQEIDIPIIGVIGVGKHCGKFESQLLLKSILDEEYETALIASNSLGTLFGCYTLPSSLFRICEFQAKIFEFNNFVEVVSENGIYDVVVIGIPEGIMPFEREEFHHFAEYPLVISSAVHIDAAILCTYFTIGLSMEHEEQALRELVLFCESRFGLSVDIVSKSRVACEVPLSEFERIIFEFLDQEFLGKHCSRFELSGFSLVNVWDRDSVNEVVDTLLLRLRENADVV